MELFERLLNGGFVGAVPVVVLLLIGAGGYLTMKRGRQDLVDSPWFWSFAFSAVGLLGVWAISGKYDDRQKRVEARYDARERIAAQRSQGSNAPSAVEQSDAPQFRLAADNAISQVGYSSDRRVPLHFLAVGLVIVSLASVVMLSRAGRSTKSDKRVKDC